MVKELGASIIDAILSEPTQTGFYRHTIATQERDSEHGSFALAVGLGSLASATAYETHFGHRPPAWAAARHPAHLTRLCREAIKLGQRLPDAR